MTIVAQSVTFRIVPVVRMTDRSFECSRPRGIDPAPLAARAPPWTNAGVPALVVLTRERPK
jgi:hypothetical protein